MICYVPMLRIKFQLCHGMYVDHNYYVVNDKDYYHITG